MERKVWRGSLQPPSSVFVAQGLSLRDAQLSSQQKKKQIKISFSVSAQLIQNVLTKVNQDYQYYFSNINKVKMFLNTLNYMG